MNRSLTWQPILDEKVHIPTIYADRCDHHTVSLMKITSQEEYGLRCLLQLARAQGSLTIPDIAAAEGLSVPYVAKLLSVLRQAGLIDSERGRTGGYRLAGAPADVSLGQVLLVLGERLFDEP